VKPTAHRQGRRHFFSCQRRGFGQHDQNCLQAQYHNRPSALTTMEGWSIHLTPSEIILLLVMRAHHNGGPDDGDREAAAVELGDGHLRQHLREGVRVHVPCQPQVVSCLHTSHSTCQHCLLLLLQSSSPLTSSLLLTPSQSRAAALHHTQGHSDMDTGACTCPLPCFPTITARFPSHMFKLGYYASPRPRYVIGTNTLVPAPLCELGLC